MAEKGRHHNQPSPSGNSESEGYRGEDPSTGHGPLDSLADAVARVSVGVHTKLLAGYLVGALLLLGMAALTVVVIARMSDQVEELSRLQGQVDTARLKANLISSQMHFRTLGLLTNDDSQNVKISDAQQQFAALIAKAESKGTAEEAEFFRKIRVVNDRFVAASVMALTQYELGDLDEALRVHLEEERPIGAELEGAMVALVDDAKTQISDAMDEFNSDRRLLSTVGWAFSGISLATAVLIGFVMSLAFIRPVRKIDIALAKIAAGDFTRRVDVPNRDEFGTLSGNLNRMTERLGELYDELQSLNRDLQVRVDDQVQELERAARMKRYLSPQLAESILAGDTDVDLSSRRQNLTIFFSDIRGFTSMSERLEPEELVDILNQYLAEMTEIVFRHGGTLDKYIGDAIMVFFGNPVPYEDHPQRAVRAAFEMRTKLAELWQRWGLEGDEVMNIGIGVTTGYVTVGNIGSQARIDYTVLGNHVNLASRLADRAEPGQILVSEKTLFEVRDLVDSAEIDQVHLEGVTRPVKIFEINER